MAEPTQPRLGRHRPDRPEGREPQGHEPTRNQPQGHEPKGHERTRDEPAGHEPEGHEPEARGPDGRRAQTRQRILAAAGHLFRQHGVDGVGVDAVMQQAGLTHGGFYLHFPSKEALAAEVSQTLLEQAAGRWDEISRSPDREVALERIVRHYLDPERASSARCCLLTTLGPDVARRSASRKAIGGALRDMLDALTRVLPGRKQQNALACLSTMVGAVVLSRMADDPALAEAFLAAAAASILPARRASNRSELPADRTLPD